MKHVIFAFFASVGLSVSAARADHVDFRGNISLGTPFDAAPIYGPTYEASAPGCWRNVEVNVWVPPHWDVRRDFWGRRVNEWCPGHYEVRTQRVWANGYADTRRWDRDRWEHERREHERREHRGDHDWDERRWNH